MSPVRLISRSYQWPAWLFYSRCEKRRKVGDEMWFFLPYGSIFPSKEGSRAVTCVSVRSLVPGRAVGEWDGCNGMNGLMPHALESPGGRRASYSAWSHSSWHGIKSWTTSAPVSQQEQTSWGPKCLVWGTPWSASQDPAKCSLRSSSVGSYLQYHHVFFWY